MLKVLFWSFPSPRWICLTRLSGLHLPRFGIRVYLLLRYSRSVVPYSVIFGTISQVRPTRDFLHPPPGGRAPTPLYLSAGTTATCGSKTPEPIYLKSGVCDYVHSPTHTQNMVAAENGERGGHMGEVIPLVLYFFLFLQRVHNLP